MLKELQMNKKKKTRKQFQQSSDLYHFILRRPPKTKKKKHTKSGPGQLHNVQSAPDAVKMNRKYIKKYIIN